MKKPTQAKEEAPKLVTSSPRPWKASIGKLCIEDAKGNTLAVAYTTRSSAADYVKQLKQRKKDLKLMAAAPRMRGTLIALKSQLIDGGHYPEGSVVIGVIDATLKTLD